MKKNLIQYDKNRFKIWAIPHPLILFWILFPALVINELILGQRQPRVWLIDRKSDKPWVERGYIPCPHCETLNDQRIWTKGNAFGHWFGLICPSCHEVIPCLWNVFSLAILVITFPIWYFPARFFRHRWIEKEKERVTKALERPLIQAKSIKWLYIGIFIWGGLMWLFMEVIPQIWDVLHGKEWNWDMMLIGLSIYLLGGLVWGLCMRFWMNRKGRNT